MNYKKKVKNEMVVETLSGKRLLVSGNMLIGKDCCLNLDHYNNDLTRYHWLTNECDSKLEENRVIVKLYRAKLNTFDEIFEDNNLMIEWERPKVPVLSLKDIKDKLGFDFILGEDLNE